MKQIKKPNNSKTKISKRSLMMDLAKQKFANREEGAEGNLTETCEASEQKCSNDLLLNNSKTKYSNIMNIAIGKVYVIQSDYIQSIPFSKEGTSTISGNLNLRPLTGWELSPLVERELWHKEKSHATKSSKVFLFKIPKEATQLLWDLERNIRLGIRVSLLIQEEDLFSFCSAAECFFDYDRNGDQFIGFRYESPLRTYEGEILLDTN